MENILFEKIIYQRAAATVVMLVYLVFKERSREKRGDSTAAAKEMGKIKKTQLSTPVDGAFLPSSAS
jgi:hypothetical protein